MFVSLFTIQKHPGVGKKCLLYIIDNAVLHGLSPTKSLPRDSKTYIRNFYSTLDSRFYYLFLSSDIFSTSSMIHTHDYTLNLVIPEATLHPKPLILIPYCRYFQLNSTTAVTSNHNPSLVTPVFFSISSIFSTLYLHFVF